MRLPSSVQLLMPLLLAGCERVSGLSELEFECFPDAIEVTCASLACGETTNNCGEIVSCPDTCPPPYACEVGGVAANTCGCTGTASPPPPPPPACVEVAGIASNTYYVCSFTNDFAGARETCRGLGMDLAIIGDLAENSLLHQSLQPTTRGAFIGLWDEGCDAVQCAFEWVDGSLLGYSRWYPGEPNNTGGAEHCAEMRADGYWNDIPCANQARVMCETTCPP